MSPVIAIIHLVLGRNGIEIMTVEGPQGGFVRLRGEGRCHSIGGACHGSSPPCCLGGRRAEIALFGHAPVRGGVGEPHSDLGRATAMAVYLETDARLCPPPATGVPEDVRSHDTASPMTVNLAPGVNARLEEAECTCCFPSSTSRWDALVHLARELARARTLEGSQLRNVLADVQVRLSGVRP